MNYACRPKGVVDGPAALGYLEEPSGKQAIAETIVDQGGNYILQVKDNHPSLRADLELLFAEGVRTDCLGVRHAFTEDNSRLRKGHAAENFSRLRRLALNLLKKDKTLKVAIKKPRPKPVPGIANTCSTY